MTARISGADCIDREAVAAQWRMRGFSCALWVDPPGQVWSDFVHDSDELLMVVEGELEIECQGKRWRPGPGEEVFIPRHAVHTVRNVGRSTARWLYGYGSDAAE